MLTWFKIVLLGILEGITEWLPVSSTGHLILLGKWLALPQRPAFEELFDVVIQLGAVLAVVPQALREVWEAVSQGTPLRRQRQLRLWGLVLLALLPSALLGFLLDDWLSAHFYSPMTVAIMLILWGGIFLLTEARRRHHPPTQQEVENISLWQAVRIGCMQVFSLLPGTSRSGSTMIGGMSAGLSRTAATKFSFWLAIPTMLGASLLKGIKFFAEGNTLLPTEALFLLLGSLVAFAVSKITLGFLCDYVKQHTLIPFGIYRMALGLGVLFYTYC